MPKKILVSLLGRPGKNEDDGMRHYNKAEYLINTEGRSYSPTTEFSFDALNKVFKPDEVVIIGTEQSIWERATEQTGIKYQKVVISASSQETDQWKTFDEVSEVFNRDAEFIIDVTHGYRHLPILTFLSAQFIQSLNPKCRVSSVFYGLHEGGDNPHTFMVDLSKFMRIMDWMYATRLFTSHGKGYDLANLLHETGDRDLNKVGSALSTLTDSLELLEVPGVPVVAQEIMTAVGKADPKKNAEIYEMLKDEMTRLPKALSKPESDWKKYLRMADWYEKHRQWAKAVLTLREAFVTFVGETCGFNYRAFKSRVKIAEHVLNADPNPGNGLYEIFFKVWSDITSFRNDLGHANIRRNSTHTIERVGELIHKANSLFPQLLKQDPELTALKKLGKRAGIKKVHQPTIQDLARQRNRDRR